MITSAVHLPTPEELAAIAGLGPIAEPPLRVAYYGEFDPFSGGVPYDMTFFPLVLDQVKLLLAVCDAVITAPGSMLSHPLALPTFEVLAPFAMDGRLGTSGTEGMAPIEYLENKAMQRKSLWLPMMAGERANGTRMAWANGEVDTLLNRMRA